MSSSDIAVSVRGLSKAYTIAHNAAKHTTAGEALMHRLKHPLQKVEKETFWALQDVEFDIKKGDVVGIIGRNGAGKSTLLKILSRITEPTTGRIALYGRVGSLLEVGTGFHPELTGRENIFLNGAILGMSKREIAREFDAIVDFSGTEQFLDTPVKRYSSGMYVRLAFAVAAHLNPEILIVDEVLAVGDAIFQKKCLGKMQSVAEQDGRTVLFVSHNMQAIRRLCNKAILLKSGKILASGSTAKVADEYLAEMTTDIVTLDLTRTLNDMPQDPILKIHDICLFQEGKISGIFTSTHPIVVVIRYELFQKAEGFRVALDLADHEGTVIFRSFHDEDAGSITVLDTGTYVAEATIPAHLLGPLRYELRVLAGIHNIRWCTPLPGICIPIVMTTVSRHDSIYVSTPFTGSIGSSLSWNNRLVSLK